MSQKKKRIVGFDLETGSAKRLYTWAEPEPFIVLCGWIEDGITHVTNDPAELLEVLMAADIIYGHNIYAFDIPALAVHAGADFEALMAKAFDTVTLAQEEHPPAPKTMPVVLYNLQATAERVGVEGKTDASKRLAGKKVAELAEAAAEGLTGREAQAAKRAVKAKYKDVYDAAHLIDWWDPELIEYLEGDLVSNQNVFRKLWKHLNRGVSRDELENFRNLNRMVFLGCRVHRPTAELRVAEENAKVAEARMQLSEMCPGIPEEAESPLATDLGKAAFEAGLIAAGVEPEHIPRTPNTGKVSTAKDALSSGDWVVTIEKEQKRFDARSKESYIQIRKVRERRQGLRQLYPDNPQVQTMCELATTISGKSRKFAEILGKTGPDDMVHAKIGSLQVSRRVAFVEPSITNVGKRGVGLQQRSLIIPRRDDEVLMCSDLSQGDMRIMAALSQDPEYMKLFVGDRDAHAEVAVALLGTKELQELAAQVGAYEALLQMNMMYLRDQAKAIGHGVNYGMGIDSTIANTGLPREIVERYFRMRAQTYRVLNRWTDEARKEAESGWIRDNGFGRSMRCDPLQAHTQGPALYGQSGTREIIMRGVRQMPLWVKQMLLMVVHDEVVLSVPRARYEEVAMIVQESLRVTWRDVFFDCDVSNPGENWGECYDKAKGQAWQKHYKEYQESLAMAA
jgi:DNA polymerase-1